MREIKFRGWDAEKHKMWNHCVPLLGEQVCNCSDLESGGFNRLLSGINLMQYTGINDINGIEVYEGDIIQIDDMQYIVEFSEAAFVAKNKNRTTMDLLCNLSGFAVVGNIFQNPLILTQ